MVEIGIQRGMEMAIHLDEGVDVPAVLQQPSNREQDLVREENETHCDCLLIDDNLH